MSKGKNRGFKDNLNDRERAKLRGKGRTPDYKPSSDEGHIFTGEIGMRGDNTGLRGHTVSEKLQGHTAEERTAIRNAERDWRNREERF